MCAWALATPNVIDPAGIDAHGVDVYADDEANDVLRNARDWLARLDDDPGPCVRWVANQRGANKLGFYFGALVEYAARFCPAIGATAVTVHRQVAADGGAGKMVGQLKLVVRRRVRCLRGAGGGEGGGGTGDDGVGDEEAGSEEIVHWEYNVKYFVDGGGCCTPTRRRQAEAARRRRAGVSDAASADDDDPSETIELAPPPSADACYVGPFLHENLHVRVQEARRKLALASHPRVADWLERWARCELSEDTTDGAGHPAMPPAEISTPGKDPPDAVAPKRNTLARRASQQILRGYLFYPLDGDERGRVGWENVAARGSANPGHLRGWWVDRLEDLARVPASHRGDAWRTTEKEAKDAEGDSGASRDAPRAMLRVSATTARLLDDVHPASGGGGAKKEYRVAVECVDAREEGGEKGGASSSASRQRREMVAGADGEAMAFRLDGLSARSELRVRLLDADGDDQSELCTCGLSLRAALRKAPVHKEFPMFGPDRAVAGYVTLAMELTSEAKERDERTSSASARHSFATPAAVSAAEAITGERTMWAVMTRKCHWLGPCEAVRSVGPNGAADLNGASTDWVVRGVPEIGIRDVEVVPHSRVEAAVGSVLESSGRGVLVAELAPVLLPATDGGDEASRLVWRERSRGFVLPRDWDPWTTVMRQDPFRRRYERGVAVAASEDTPCDVALDPEGRYECVAAAHADVATLGDDIRVRDKETLDARRALRIRLDEEGVGIGARHRGEAGASRKDDAGAALSAAAADGAEALVTALREMLREEGGTLPRPVRPHVTRALAVVGDAEPADGAKSGERDGRQDPFFLARPRDTKALVARAVRGAELCLRALDVEDAEEGESVENGGEATPETLLDESLMEFTDETDESDASKELTVNPLLSRSVFTVAADGSDVLEEEVFGDELFGDVDAEEDDVVGGSKTKTTALASWTTMSMSERRGVSHAMLDALGPAARRHGCVGADYAGTARAVFDLIFAKSPSSRWTVSPSDTRESTSEAFMVPVSTGDATRAFRKGGVCPRVAVRLCHVLRLRAPQVLRDGAALALAESIAKLVSDAASDVDTGTEDAPDNQKDTLRSRVGPVVELLVWAGEAGRLSDAAARTLTQTCVEIGASSAAEALARALPSLSRPLARAHAELGNHRAARRVVSEANAEAASIAAPTFFHLEKTERDNLRLDDQRRVEASQRRSGPSADRSGVDVGSYPEMDVARNDAVMGDDGCSAEAATSARSGSARLPALFGGAPGAPPPPLHELLGSERTLLVASREALASAKDWIEAAMEVDDPDGDLTRVIGLDCEWRPGKAADGRSNPVALVQLAAGAAGAHDGGARAVLLDCLALLGPTADRATATATAGFLEWVFSTAAVVGFGVAGDVKRLRVSYEARFERFPLDGGRTSSFEGVRTICVRDVAASRGISPTAAASLASLSRVLLDDRAPDKSQQRSDWGARPLSAKQTAYAALDALLPAMILRRLLATHPSAVHPPRHATTSEDGRAEGSTDEAKTSRSLALNIGAAARPWTRLERLFSDDASENGECPRASAEDGRRTVEDVRAALRAAEEGKVLGPGGLRLEEWEVVCRPSSREPSSRLRFGGEDDDEEDDADGSPENDHGLAVPSGVRLCKTLGVIAEGGIASSRRRLIVCVLEARERLRLDMAAVASLLNRDSSTDERVRCRLATPEELVAEFGFPRGSMGPVGLRHPPERYRVFMDDAIFRDNQNGDASPTSALGSPIKAAGRGVMDKSWRLVAVGGGAPAVKLVGRAAALAELTKATVASVSQVDAA